MSEVFEGAEVTEFQAKIPAITVDCEEPFRHGTILRLAMEVRVRGVRHEEDKNGDMVRLHVLGVEELSVVSNFDPSQDRTAVGGSASATPEQDPEGAEELGLEIGRSSQSWPNHVAMKDGKLVNTNTGEVVVDPSDLPDEPEDDEEGEPEPDPDPEEAEDEEKSLASAEAPF